MTYKEALNKRLQEPEFKKEWDALEPEFQLIKAMLDAREKAGADTTTVIGENGNHTGRYLQDGKRRGKSDHTDSQEAS